MSDVFTETSSQNWFTRMKNALIGILFGILMFFGSFIVLVWNEGNAVYEAKSIAEGEKSVQEISSETVDPSLNGKLIHITGEATTSDTLTDPEFQIDEIGILLNREVEMYQWQEESKKETKDKLGGTRETTTIYSYQKTWASGRNNSENFKRAEEHRNPVPKFEPKSWDAAKVTVGAFQLNKPLISKINNFQDRPFTEEDLEKLDQSFRENAVINAGKLYWSPTGKPVPGDPIIGDIRISHRINKPADVSILAKQQGNDLLKYETSVGSGVMQLRMGKMSAEEMFTKSKAELSSFTWLLRLGGFVLMGIGISLVLAPIGTFFEFIPFLGNMATGAIGIIAFLIAAPLSLITISLAWLFYRPLIGVALLLAAGGCIGLLIWAIKKFRKPQTQQGFQPNIQDDVPTVY